MIRLKRLVHDHWDVLSDGVCIGSVVKMAKDEWYFIHLETMCRTPLDVPGNTVAAAVVAVAQCWSCGTADVPF